MDANATWNTSGHNNLIFFLSVYLDKIWKQDAIDNGLENENHDISFSEMFFLYYDDLEYSGITNAFASRKFIEF